MQETLLSGCALGQLRGTECRINTGSTGDSPGQLYRHEFYVKDIVPSPWAGMRQCHHGRVPPFEQTGMGMQAAAGIFK